MTTLDFHLDKENSTIKSSDDRVADSIAISTKHSINLAAKVKKLSADGHLSPFLSHSFLEQLERVNNFERKGA